MDRAERNLLRLLKYPQDVLTTEEVLFFLDAADEADRLRAKAERYRAALEALRQLVCSVRKNFAPSIVLNSATLSMIDIINRALSPEDQ